MFVFFAVAVAGLSLLGYQSKDKHYHAHTPPVMWTVPARPTPPEIEVQPLPPAEDDPNWECSKQGNRVCGQGADPDFPDSWTVDGEPVDELYGRMVAHSRSFEG